MTDDDGELLAWLQLLPTAGLGRRTLRRLLAAFGSPQAVLAAPAGAIAAVAGPEVAAAVQSGDTAAARARLDATRAWLAAAPGRRHLLGLADAAYPALLLQTADPPLLLFAEGRLDLLDLPALAIVGSRHATPQGLDNARAFARHFSQAGWTVVSGLAAGIDGAAHEGALDGEGSTIAVIGTGLDIAYPRAHARLTQRIAEQGLLLGEYLLGTPPLAANFPRRNAVIAGLARGTLVVEAAVQSGSLITARLAAEAGREVFAIPGSIHAPQSRGCHRLIQQGAKLVETAEDVLQELPALALAPAAPDEPSITPAGTPADHDESDPVLRALGHEAATLDALVARCGWPAAELSARLLDLELDGRVARLPGGLFQRCARA